MSVFLAPGLAPGKTLSNDDTLWFNPPWLAEKPAGLTVPSNPDLGDWSQWVEPFFLRVREEMPHVPLWNPYIAGGRPLQGNGQAAVFGPFTWPGYLLPFWTALGWIGVLKLWVAAFGTYLLGRSLGMRPGGAFLAGLVYALNLKLVTWLIYSAMGVWSWYPWLLLCVDRLVRRPDPLTGAALAAVVGLQFLTGHPESSAHALLLSCAFFAFRLWQKRRSGEPGAFRRRRPLVAFGGALAGGTALAAVSLIPFVELLSLSADIVDRRGASVGQSLPFKDVIGLFLPDYWGRPTQTPIRPIMLERAMYVGALPLMLAVVALVLRRTATRIAVAVFGLVWFAVAVGIPPVVQIVTRLPVFSSGHNTRLIVFFLLCVSLLAGWGLDDLSGRWRAPPSRYRLALALCVGILAVPLFIVAIDSPSALAAPRGGFEVAWLFSDPPGEFRWPIGVDVIRASALIIWLTVAGAALLLIALRTRRRLAGPLFIGLALLLVCVDLFRIGMGQNPAIDRDLGDFPATGALRYLERQGDARFVSTRELPHNVIPMRFHLYEAAGYDVPIVRRYDRLWRQEVVAGESSVAAGFLSIPLELHEVTPRALRTLRLLGVTHILGPKTVESGVPPHLHRQVELSPLRAQGLTLVYDGPDARVYKLSGALPRAWVVGAEQRVDGDGAALAAITDRGFQARKVAITQRSLGLPASPAGGDGAATARITAYEPERVTVRATSPGQGLLVLSDNQFPGWKATVDGRPASIERVDYLFRGVRIGPGTHTVEFRYQPLSFRAGWIISLVALVGIGATAAIGWRRRREPEPSELSGAAVGSGA